MFWCILLFGTSTKDILIDYWIICFIHCWKLDWVKLFHNPKKLFFVVVVNVVFVCVVVLIVVVVFVVAFVVFVVIFVVDFIVLLLSFILLLFILLLLLLILLLLLLSMLLLWHCLMLLITSYSVLVNKCWYEAPKSYSWVSVLVGWVGGVVCKVIFISTQLQCSVE